VNAGSLNFPSTYAGRALNVGDGDAEELVALQELASLFLPIGRLS